jgi:hypothetical protein
VGRLNEFVIDDSPAGTAHRGPAELGALKERAVCRSRCPVGVKAGFILAFNLLLQLGFNWTALHAGLTMIPSAFGTAVGTELSDAVLAEKLGRRTLHLGLAPGCGRRTHALVDDRGYPVLRLRMLSSALTAAWSALGRVWRYFWVVVMLEWPIRSLTT